MPIYPYRAPACQIKGGEKRQNTQRRALWGKVEEGGGGWPKSRRVTKTQAGDEWAGGEWAGGE